MDQHSKLRDSDQDHEGLGFDLNSDIILSSNNNSNTSSQPFTHPFHLSMVGNNYLDANPTDFAIPTIDNAHHNAHHPRSLDPVIVTYAPHNATTVDTTGSLKRPRNLKGPKKKEKKVQKSTSKDGAVGGMTVVVESSNKNLKEKVSWP